MESEALQSLSLKIIVGKEKNQVFYVESNKDFIDVLFSFMTIPIGTIARLTREHSLGGEIGCLNNLYESIENLDVEFVQSQKWKDILLHPRSAAEIYMRNLKQNLTESDSHKYYVCCSNDCGLLSYYQTHHCCCGNDLKYKLNLPIATSVPQEGGVFVKPTMPFMISDDFQVKPMSTMTAISFLMSKLGVMDGKTIEERTVSVGRDELLKLLKCSLTSKTPFSDTFMGPPSTNNFFTINHGNYGPRSKDLKLTDVVNKEKMISLKLIVSKSKNKALYAEVKKDFLDLLCSFLTVPLGYVFKGFPSLPSNGCVNNLYKSIENIEVELFESEEMKETLVNPKLAPGLAYNNQLIDIEEATEPSYSTLSSRFMAKCYNLDPMSQLEVVKIGKGFIKGPSVFMVMDNLTVSPLSSISGISLITKLQIPLTDIEEREVTMDEDEAMRLLVASLVSECALTDAFLVKEPKQEQ